MREKERERRREREGGGGGRGREGVGQKENLILWYIDRKWYKKVKNIIFYPETAVSITFQYLCFVVKLTCKFMYTLCIGSTILFKSHAQAPP